MGVFKTSGIGLAMLCGAIAFAGCGGSDSDGNGRTGATGTGGTGTGGTGTGGTGTGGTGTGGTGAGGTGTGGTGTGGTGTGGTGGVANACPSAITLTGPSILDFDDGAVQDDPVTLGMYVYGDPAGGTIAPIQGMEAEGVDSPGADGSQSAFSFVGAAFPATSYGGGLGIWMNCRNASTATGIKFWLKSDQPVIVKVEVPANKKIADGGECAGDDSTCKQASFEVAATAADTWEEREVSFTQLTGGMPVSTFDASKVTGIGFEIKKPTDAADGWGWDTSIDQVEWLGVDDTGAGGGGGEGGNP